MKKIDYSKIEELKIEESTHLTHSWEPLKFNIKENYRFIKKGIIFNFFSKIVLFIIVLLASIVDKIFLGYKIINKKKLISTGCISISNHIHNLDCTMIGILYYPRRLYYPTVQNNFKIPVVRWLIRLLCAVPIPSSDNLKSKFYNEINLLLKNNKIVHMYPEGSLWPYYEKVRTFKYGAFKMAVDSNVPIEPIKFIFVEPYGIYKLYKKSKCIHGVVLDPIYPNNKLEYNDRIEDLRKRTYEAMKEGE